MKIIHSGGYNNKDEASIRSSFIHTYRPAIVRAARDGKRVGFVTLAKPDGYFDPLIRPLYGAEVDVIDSKRAPTVKWETYDGLFLFGGDSVPLVEGLRRGGFALDLLKRDAVVLGDSAGSYALSSYFYKSPRGALRGVEVSFHAGLNPGARMITVAHTNNPVFCNDLLVAKVNAFAREKGLHVLALAENEQKTLTGGEYVPVLPETIFA